MLDPCLVPPDEAGRRHGSSSTMSGGSGGFLYDGYAFCSPPIMSNTDPLLLAALSPPTLQSEEHPLSATPHMQLSQPAVGLTLQGLGAAAATVGESQASPLGSVSPVHAAQQMTEMACAAASMVEDVPCCPLVMPLSLDVSREADGGGGASCLPPLPLQESTMPLSYAASSAKGGPVSAAAAAAAAAAGGAPPALLQCGWGQSVLAPPEPGAVPARSGARRVGRGGAGGPGRVRGQHHQDTDEKLRNLLYQEYAPMYPSGTAAETPGSGTEYVQSPPGPDSAAGGSGNRGPPRRCRWRSVCGVRPA